MSTTVGDTHALSASLPDALSGPSRSLQWWSFILPVLKCALCPACLSLFGGVFAGARLGFLGDERLHEVVIGAALVADVLILGAAFRHHRFPWPLAACGLGALLIVAGHLTHVSPIEVSGFIVLIVAAFWNWRVLRKHHREHTSTCTHCNHDRAAVDAAPAPIR